MPGPPIACTLDASAVADRLAEWHSVLGRGSVTAISARARRAELGPDADVGQLARLVLAEHECCAFLSFAITVDARGIGLEISAPEGAEATLEALFGT